ncbi:putative general secretion pathway protein J [Bradyrhizobium oligotrophicum S58]|uniref:Putative general secretion pathway protein J n=1 Tax=Bradyrhizobium oligotrophicum S58 TaxID=1245469 RepID=M4Z2V7_9BRAD|nr:prepilin-type N-terminal cleavage/methylation domain-containing protein [Bradyrhizobium oligotrophicum]BAM87608.1 putative general secretion pathway protein J [Bradyrhizobium oligotrophicum S58]
MSTRPNDPQSGFTLIESLVAMVLMGLLVSALLAITSQWLPNWDRGLRRIQRSESLSVALDRISADIAAAEFIRPDGQSKSVLFDGSDTSITLVRSSLGPNRNRGLDLVHIAEAPDRDGVALARTRAAFAPGDGSARNFADPVVLLQAPYRVVFSYAGADRIWQPSWRNAEKLPTAVQVTIRDATGGNAMSISRIATIHISAPAESVCSSANSTCDRQSLLTNATTGRASARSEQ